MPCPYFQKHLLSVLYFLHRGRMKKLYRVQMQFVDEVSFTELIFTSICHRYSNSNLSRSSFTTQDHTGYLKCWSQHMKHTQLIETFSSMWELESQFHFVHTGVVHKLCITVPRNCTHFEDEWLPQYLESVLNLQVEHFINTTQ